MLPAGCAAAQLPPVRRPARGGRGCHSNDSSGRHDPPGHHAPRAAAAAAAAQQPDTADLETTYKAYLVADVLAKVGAGNFNGAASSKRKLDAILAEAA